MLRQVFRRLLRSQIKSRSRSNLQSSPWTFGGLEERLLLAADTGVAMSHSSNDYAGSEVAGDYSHPAAIYGQVFAPKISNTQEINQSLESTDDSYQAIDVSILSDSVEDAPVLVFIDSRVESYETMVADLKGRAEVHIVESSVSGLSFISEVLSGRNGVGSIHLIGHGKEGYLELGCDGLNQSSVDKNRVELA